MEALLIPVLALAGLSACCSLGTLLLLARQRKTEETDLPWETDDRDSAPEAETKSLSPDEGFENLMAYQVKLGRGASTGGEA